MDDEAHCENFSHALESKEHCENNSASFYELVDSSEVVAITVVVHGEQQRVQENQNDDEIVEPTNRDFSDTLLPPFDKPHSGSSQPGFIFEQEKRAFVVLCR